MRIEHLNDNCIFAFVPALEPMWGALSLLRGDEKALAPCKELYGEEKISHWRRKYRFLFECFEAVRTCGPNNMLDLLLDQPLENVSLETYRDTLLTMPAEDFLWRQLDLSFVEGADKDTVAKALIVLEKGDRIDFICDYYRYDGSYENSYLLGEQLVYDGDLTVSDVLLTDSVCMCYRFTDLYQQNYWTTPVD